MKTYKYGNIEKSWYRTGNLRTDFVVKTDDDNTILRSTIYSEDGTARYSHIDFSAEELRLIRTWGDFTIPSRQVIEFIYNDPILYSDNLFYNDILNIIRNSIPPNIPVPEGQPVEGIEINWFKIYDLKYCMDFETALRKNNSSEILRHIKNGVDLNKNIGEKYPIFFLY